MREKITFEDLSLGLKIPIIISYVVGTIWLLFFLGGIIGGVMS